MSLRGSWDTTLCHCGVKDAKHLNRHNEADKASGAPMKLANLPPNIDCPKLHPQMKGTFPLATSLATLKIRRDLEGRF